MCCLNVYEVKYNHTATTCHQAVVITAAVDGGANGKSSGWENVSPSNEVTVMYTHQLCKDIYVCPKLIISRQCAICSDFVH